MRRRGARAAEREHDPTRRARCAGRARCARSDDRAEHRGDACIERMWALRATVPPRRGARPSARAGAHTSGERSRRLRAPTHRTRSRARHRGGDRRARTIGQNHNSAVAATCTSAAEHVATTNVRELVEQRGAQKIGVSRAVAGASAISAGGTTMVVRTKPITCGPTSAAPIRSCGARTRKLGGELWRPGAARTPARAGAVRAATTVRRCARIARAITSVAPAAQIAASTSQTIAGHACGARRQRCERRRQRARDLGAARDRVSSANRSESDQRRPGPHGSANFTTTTSQIAACHAGRKLARQRGSTRVRRSRGPCPARPSTRARRATSSRRGRR